MTQTFFDQGLRLAWGFYFPESIASYQQASAYDPDHPMPYWGMAHAMGPNPNSRYIQMPDDPLGEGLKAIKNAMDRIDNASSIEAELIQAMWIAYDKQSIPDQLTRDRAYLAEMRKLNQKYPNDSDIAALYAASYMNIGRWDYWDSEGNPKDETAAVGRAGSHHRQRPNQPRCFAFTHSFAGSLNGTRTCIDICRQSRAFSPNRRSRRAHAGSHLCALASFNERLIKTSDQKR